jgi:S-adenosylmethionine hydrolase
VPILTLTTDWGLRDHYVAAFKGELYSRCPEIQIVDISHQIEHFDILQASFIIRNCFEKFPPGTLHFIGISSTMNVGHRSQYLIVKCRDHFFLGEDNGIFSLILSDATKEIYRLPVSDHPSSSEIHDLFLFVISFFFKGKSAFEIGTLTDQLVHSFHTQPVVDHSGIRGAVIYIDSFGNIISNITKELFEQEVTHRSFTIFLRRSEYDIHKISKNYFDVEAGEIVALFNRAGLLKLAINKGSAGGLLGMKMMDTIRIEFI